MELRLHLDSVVHWDAGRKVSEKMRTRKAFAKDNDWTVTVLRPCEEMGHGVKEIDRILLLLYRTVPPIRGSVQAGAEVLLTKTHLGQFNIY